MYTVLLEVVVFLLISSFKFSQGDGNETECSVNGDCEDINARCDLSHGGMCVCVNGTHRDEPYRIVKCSFGRALNQTCRMSKECQLIDHYSMCFNHTCQCQPGYYALSGVSHPKCIVLHSHHGSSNGHSGGHVTVTSPVMAMTATSVPLAVVVATTASNRVAVNGIATHGGDASSTPHHHGSYSSHRIPPGTPPVRMSLVDSSIFSDSISSTPVPGGETSPPPPYSEGDAPPSYEEAVQGSKDAPLASVATTALPPHRYPYSYNKSLQGHIVVGSSSSPPQNSRGISGGATAAPLRDWRKGSCDSRDSYEFYPPMRNPPENAPNGGETRGGENSSSRKSR